jgi:hypothetical protein
MKRIKGVRPVMALLLASQVAACMTWKPIAGDPDYFSREKPAWVRVETTDGRRILIDDPFIASDTLAGVVHEGDQSGLTPGVPIQIALSDVHRIEEHGANAEGTAVAVLAVGVALVLMVQSAMGEGLGR